MSNEEFNLEAIEKTFTSHKVNEIIDAFIVQQREDGFIVNIGGKKDAFIKNSEFDDVDSVKIGDSFKAIILSMKNEEGLVEISKRKAEENISGQEIAVKLKIGSKFSCVITSAHQGGISSRLGEYEIFIPAGQIAVGFTRDLKSYIGKSLIVAVVEIDNENKKIIASKKILEEEENREVEESFWRSIFENKVVRGEVKRFVPYGAFVNVDGVDCLVHISDISYERINSPSEVLELGKTYQFRVLKVDRNEKRVNLGYKQLQTDPTSKKIMELVVGEEKEGVVVKILKFGAIIKLDNGVEGLLHISNATQDSRKNIYEIVKLGQVVQVKIISIDPEQRRVSFGI